MGKLLENLHLTLVIGLVFAVGLMLGLNGDNLPPVIIVTWLHVLFGILWIGLLYYFNFVQIPTMPSIPAEPAGDRQAYCAQGIVLLPLGGAGDGDHRAAGRLSVWL